jgi:transglutaminase-like putative cysteine protease
MARLSTRALRDPNVIHAANLVIAGATPRDVRAQIEAIGAFMDSSFRFVPNPQGTQTIRPPGWTGKPLAPGMLEDLTTRGITQGACDDAAVLIATLAMANGIPARFRALAFCVDVDGRCDPTVAYTHVIADLFDGQDWRELDVTRPFDVARPRAAEIQRTLIYNIS